MKPRTISPGRWLSGCGQKQRELQKHEYMRIKVKLGLGHNDPLPRCPSRSMAKLKKLASLGDVSHTKHGHVCGECGCNMTAGYGTGHLGYGYCYIHEKYHGSRESLEVMEAHRHALMERHPSVYRDPGRFAELVRKEGEESGERLSLIEDIRIARGALQELLLAAEGKRKGAGGEVLPLMEYVGKEAMPMSDRTRLGLVGTLATRVSKIVRDEAELRRETSISMDEFRVWFARMWRVVTEACQNMAAGEIRTGKELEGFFRDKVSLIGQPGARRRGV